MPRPVQTTMAERARSFLSARIERARAEGARRLPTVLALATECGVSHMTLLRALEPFKRAGTIESTRRRGITLSGSTSAHDRPPPVETPRAPSAAHRTSCAIDTAIRSGVFAPGQPLPSPKELTVSCGVCHRTLSASLKRLARAGVLEQHRHWYRVAHPHAARSDASVVLITVGQSSGRISVHAPWTVEQLHALERECALAGLHLHVLVVDSSREGLFDSSGVAVPRLDTFIRRAHAIGALMWTMAIDPARVTALISQAQYAQCPVSILDDAGALSDSAATSLPARCAVFGRNASVRAGQILGRFLLRLGHRHAAYIAPYAPDWSRQRLQGLSDAFGEVPGARVSAFAIDSPDAPGAVSYALRSEVLAALRVHLPGGLSPDSALAHLRDYHVGEMADAGVALDQIRPLLVRARRERGITVWVCACDIIGLAALEFLARSGARPPLAVSVAGFDDGLEASIGQLTSYNFNQPAVMRATLAHVIAPHARRGTYRTAQVDVDGYVTPRSTTWQRDPGT